MTPSELFVPAPGGSIRECLTYDASTGIFLWTADRRGKTRSGDIAGCLNGSGYRVISFKDVTYRAHRLAWWFVYGVMPVGLIDHINGIRTDNRIANLRVASPRANAQNVSRAKSNSATGLLGVISPSDRPVFLSSIRDQQGKRIHLGTFAAAEDAHDAYMTAKRQMHDAPACITTK